MVTFPKPFVFSSPRVFPNPTKIPAASLYRFAAGVIAFSVKNIPVLPEELLHPAPQGGVLRLAQVGVLG